MIVTKIVQMEEKIEQEYERNGNKDYKENNVLWNKKRKNFKVKRHNIEYIEEVYAGKRIESTKNNIKFSSKIDLTIIVPVYNAEISLTRCIDSLINQETKYKYEIVLINDGSTDNSLKILKKYEKKFDFIKIFTQSNKGIAETRNVGIKNITGKYVAFVDSDDYVTQDYVEKMLICAYKNDADIVRTNYYEYDTKNNRIIKTGKNMKDESILINDTVAAFN